MGGAVSDAVLTVADLPLMADMKYTAVAFDNLATIQALALVDDDTNIPAGSTRFQVVHAAAGVGQVDVWDMASGTPLIPDFDFGATVQADLPAGAYTLGLDVNNDATPDAIFEVPDLGAGTFVNVFAVADAMGPFLLAQLPDGSTTRVNPIPPPAHVRVIHLSPDAPAVDVFANDDAAMMLYNNVAFGESSAYLDVAPGTYSLQVSATGSLPADAVLEVPSVTFDPGMSYTAVAYGLLGQSMLMPMLLVDDASNIAAGNLRLQVAHTAAMIPTVDVWELNLGVKVIDNLAYGAAVAIDVPDMPLLVGLDADQNGTPDLVFNVPALGAGQLVNVFAVNEMGSVFLAAQLPDGTVAQVPAN